MLEWFLRTLGGYDKAAFAFVQTTLRNPVCDFLMPWVSDKWNWLLPVACIFAYSVVKDKRRGGWLLLSSIFLIFAVDAVATALKGEFLRLRPQQTLLEFGLLMQRPASSSFPSNHAANSFALATLLAFYHPRMAGFFFAAATLVAFSRVYLGVHYPVDVLGGALLGVAFAVAAALLLSRALRLRGPASPRQPSAKALPSI